VNLLNLGMKKKKREVNITYYMNAFVISFL